MSAENISIQLTINSTTFVLGPEDKTVDKDDGVLAPMVMSAKWKN